MESILHGINMNATLEDIKQEIWLRMRNSGDLIWKSKDREIPIKDMELSHLLNTYQFLRKREKSESTDIDSSILQLNVNKC